MAEEGKTQTAMEVAAAGSKPTSDMSRVVADAIAAANALAAGGNVSGAVEALLTAEKKARLGNDTGSTAKAAEHILQLLFDYKDFDSLNAHVLILTKRRGQSDRVITEVVKKGHAFAVALKGQPAERELLNNLRTVAEGKIYVELERALLTRRLSEILEAEGKIAEASEMLQEVAVETYGSLDKKEKLDFLLEQIRLCLAQRDYVRAEIIARKVSHKVLAEEGFEAFRVTFFQRMAELHAEKREPMELFKDWNAIYTTRNMPTHKEQCLLALKHAVMYLVLSPYNNEQNDSMQRLVRDPMLTELRAFHNLVRALTTPEIAAWPLPDQHEILGFASTLPGGDWVTDLHKRVLQHNIRVVGKYYRRIHTARLAELLGVTVEQTERYLAEAVTNSMVHALIDRPAGIVSFQKPQNASEVVSSMGADLSELLGLVDRTCHLVNKEYMVRGLA